MDWDRHKKTQKPTMPLEAYLQDLFNRPKSLLFAIGLALLISTGLTSFYTVKAEEEAVVLRLGRYVDTVGSGIHFKLPFNIDKVTKIPTKVLQQPFGLTIRESSDSNIFGRLGDTRRSRSTENYRRGNLKDESLILTGDLNVADVKWIVNYLITNPKDYLFNVADPIKNVRDIAQTTMRRVVGDISITDVINRKRNEVQIESKALMQEFIDKYKMGLTIDDVILQEVDPPEPVQPSFNEVNSALQEQKQLINQAEAEYNQIIPEAKGNAERHISEAEGYATAIVNRAEGDSRKFTKILSEYSKAPEITRTRLYLELMEEIIGRVPALTVVDPDIKGVLPIFSGISSSGDKSSSVSQMPFGGDGSIIGTR